jgi:hypothetical protein
MNIPLSTWTKGRKAKRSWLIPFLRLWSRRKIYHLSHCQQAQATRSIHPTPPNAYATTKPTRLINLGVLSPCNIYSQSNSLDGETFLAISLEVRLQSRMPLLSSTAGTKIVQSRLQVVPPAATSVVTSEPSIR